MDVVPLLLLYDASAPRCCITGDGYGGGTSVCGIGCGIGHHNRHVRCISFFTFIILVVPRRGGIGVIGGPQENTGCVASCISPCGTDSFRTLLGGGRH